LISFQEIVAEVSALERQRDKLEAELKMVLPLSLSLPCFALFKGCIVIILKLSLDFQAGSMRVY
jgi:hypothetical protein